MIQRKIVFAGILALSMFTMASAQQQGGQVPGAGGQGHNNGPQGQNQQGQNPQRFEEIKQKMIARIQERLSCVQNAQNPQALRACMPPRRGGGQGGQGGGQGGQDDSGDND